MVTEAEAHPSPIRTVGGITFEDPFAWLEDDSSADVVAWQERQNERAAAYLAQLPWLDALRAQIEECGSRRFNYAPARFGDRWFRMAAGDLGLVVEVSDSPTGEGRVVADPAALAKAGQPAALDWFYPSPTGRYVAFGASFSGDEQSVLHIVETASGEVLPDRIPFTSIATVCWLPDEGGFYYNGGHAPDWEDADKHIYFHGLGDEARSAPEPLTVREAYCLVPQISPDGRYLLAVTSEIDPRADFIKALPDGDWKPFLLDRPGRGYGVFVGDSYVAITTAGCPRGRLDRIPIATADDESTWTTLLPESEEVITSVERIGNHLVVCSLADAFATLKVLDLEGVLEREVELPGRGTVLQLGSGPYQTPSPWMGQNVSAGANEFTFVFSTLTRSPALYRYDLEEWALEELTPPEIEHLDISVRHETATAPDGSPVRYRVLHRSNLDTSQPQPTLIYAYGGWNISFIPGYLATYMPFIEAGGVLVLSHLRGGGEYGSSFWRDGRLDKKQNGFNDLYATAEALIADGVTTASQLAVVGGSNGGLLTGVAVTQRPDLWTAVCTLVGLYDMLLFDRDSYTASCTLEYGDPANPSDAETMAAYSPYHNVVEGTSYPATLIYCGANDMRCPAWQSRKLAARLQAANNSDQPILLRVVEAGGHLTVSRDPAQHAEWMGFLMHELGLQPR